MPSLCHALGDVVVPIQENKRHSGHAARAVWEAAIGGARLGTDCFIPPSPHKCSSEQDEAHIPEHRRKFTYTHTHTKQRLNSNIYNTIKDEITPWFIMVQWRFYLNCGGDFVSACGEALCFVLYRNHSFSSESMISIRPSHWRCSLSAVLLVSHILLRDWNSNFSEVAIK